MSKNEKPEEVSNFANLQKRAQASIERLRKLADEGVTAGKEVTTGAAEKMGEIATASASKAALVGGQAAKKIGDSASEALQWGSAKVENLFQEIQNVPGKVKDLVFQPCPVPTFLLPTGTSARDFACVFRFDELLDQLRGGILARPHIEVWAGREDIDREQIAGVIKQAFTNQFREQRKKIIAERLDGKGLNVLQLAEEKKKAKEGATNAALGAASWAMFMLLFTNPIVDLIFLGLALYEGTGIFSSIWNHFGTSGKLKAAEKELEKEREKLEQELDGKNEQFKAAVSKLNIRVHPFLQTMVQDFHEIERFPYLPSETVAENEAPKVGDLLLRDLDLMPEWYRPLLKERLRGL